MTKQDRIFIYCVRRSEKLWLSKELRQPIHHQLLTLF